MLLAAWVACATSAQASRIFMSPAAASPDWNVTGEQTFAIGQSATLNVWVIPDAGETLNGISLRLTSTSPGVTVVSHQLLQPALVGGRHRWDAVTVQDPQTLVPPPPLGTPGGVLNEGDFLFRDWNAAALINDTPIPGYTPSLGLSGANAGLDPLYDAATGAFLHSQLTILGGSIGEFPLSLAVGDRGVASHLLGFDDVFFGASATPVDGGSVGATDGSIHASLRVVAVAGDTDGDGAIGITDLNNVRNNFGSFGLGDTDGDGLVQISDLNNVRNNFGATAVMPAAAARLSAVPEPGTLLSAGVGIAGIFCFFGWRGRSALLESDTWSGRADYARSAFKEDRPLMN